MERTYELHMFSWNDDEEGTVGWIVRYKAKTIDEACEEGDRIAAKTKNTAFDYAIPA